MVYWKQRSQFPPPQRYLIWAANHSACLQAFRIVECLAYYAALFFSYREEERKRTCEELAFMPVSLQSSSYL